MNLFGIDFEDWYHPELVSRHIKTTDNKPSVVNGIDRILDWLRKNDTLATFFMVGELLESKPELLDKIVGAGHEIGFHTMHHTRLDAPNYRERFVEELKKFADLTNGRSCGFRAPSFSLNHSTAWAIDALVENGYLYDSSVVPVKTKLYGIEGAETKPYKISSKRLGTNDPDSKIMEFPLLTTTILGRRVPASGGFYLRALPLWIIENAIRNCNKRGQPAVFFIHSWELLPEFMPKISLPFVDRFITYHNLGKALEKMDMIIKRFKFTSFEQFISVEQ